ncbi:MAG TPA: hypothetical protein VK510_17725 [Solirubrobacteraceae bacterium]|nr:hypothetical protein [Solirubrobacteraceae bacterium]
MNRLKTAIRRLAPLVLVAFAAGAIAAHADNAPKPRVPRATVAVSSPPAEPVPVVSKVVAACRPVKKAPTAAPTPPSQALLDAFAILRRERRPEDALPPEALKALQQRNLAPVSPDSARLLRTAPGGGQAWVVPVPDVTRSAFPFACAPKGKPAPREGLAVVAVKHAAAGGGGALADLVRGRAPVSVDSCAGANGDMLGVSGIVPNGVAAVFLTAPDGTAIRADVKDNGYEFLIPRPRTAAQRYVVWTGGDGTPHVQPVLAFGVVRGAVCKQLAARDLPPQVTPGFGFGSCAVAAPVELPLPRPVVPKGGRVIPVPTRMLWGACSAAPALVVPSGTVAPFPVPVPKSPPRKHR